MENNAAIIQKQIKAFNKALSRADKANIIDNDVYEVISDLIDYNRMTKSGYAKAGTKYLERMSPEELLAYSSDISQAKGLLEMNKTLMQVDIDSAKDPKDLLWKMFQKLEDAGLAFSSKQVHAVELGFKNISVREMVIMMNKYLKDGDYGLSDFDAWFNSRITFKEYSDYEKETNSFKN